MHDNDNFQTQENGSLWGKEKGKGEQRGRKALGAFIASAKFFCLKRKQNKRRLKAKRENVMIRKNMDIYYIIFNILSVHFKNYKLEKFIYYQYKLQVDTCFMEQRLLLVVCLSCHHVKVINTNRRLHEKKASGAGTGGRGNKKCLK